MGQEQSSNPRQTVGGGAGASSNAVDDGVQRVHGSGAALVPGDKKDVIDQLVDSSNALSLPQPLLPPPAVKDDISSALQGTQMMHELRNALDGLWHSTEESLGVHTNVTPQPEETTLAQSGETPAGQSAGTEGGVSDRAIGTSQDAVASHIDEITKLAAIDPRAEQEQWARLGIDQASIHAMLEECSGGSMLNSILDRQSALMKLISAAKENSIRLNTAMDRNSGEARRTTNALEKLDRINVALADIQENLESAVATANILGASHFAHDEEMCSFKNFLKHNPPSVT